MLRIVCPFCGERDHIEFSYAGDANQAFPGLDDHDIGHWTNFVFFRDNKKGLHTEYWQHSAGCRQWLKVERDTVSHEIASVIHARSTQQAAAPRMPDAAE